jgi:hypothetical protein
MATHLIIPLPTFFLVSAAFANEPPLNAEVAFPAYSFLSSREIWMAFLVLIFASAVGAFCVILVRTKALSAEQVIRITALLMIVTGTLLLVVTGYSAEQIAPALGLLGTVAGYLLGRSDAKAESTTIRQHPGDADDNK